jgi:hypothetical protein
MWSIKLATACPSSGSARNISFRHVSECLTFRFGLGDMTASDDRAGLGLSRLNDSVTSLFNVRPGTRPVTNPSTSNATERSISDARSGNGTGSLPGQSLSS